MSAQQWFYAGANQQQVGPMSLSQLQELASSGTIQPTTLVWNESMESWKPASQVDGILNGASPVVSNNPYSAPQYNPTPVPSGDYPIPIVKKVSYPLYIIPIVIGCLIGTIGAVLFFMSLPSSDSDLDTYIVDEQGVQIGNDSQTQPAVTEEVTPVETDKMITGGVMMGVGLLFFLMGFIYGMIILYRAWTVLQPGGARTTPGKAVGFMFIPLFNIYWMFVAKYGWSQDWNRIRQSYQNLSSVPRATEGLFLTACISNACSIVVGALAVPVTYICTFIMIFQMSKVVNFIATQRS